MLRQEALLAWLQKVIDQNKLVQQDLSDPKLFIRLAEEIPGIRNIQYTKPQNNSMEWQTKYVNFKQIYQSIESYYRDQLNSSFPSGLPSINLLLMSKGEQNQSLMVLLQIFFIGCIECKAKQKFIAQIMNLEQGQMTQLMRLIQETSLNKQQTKYEDVGDLHHDKQKIDELYFKIQSLYSENDALRHQFMTENQQKIKLQEQVQKLEDEKKKLRRQLDEKMIYLQQKQQQQLQQQSTNKVISQSNEQIIVILKKQLLDQEHKYLGITSRLKEEISDLKQQLERARQKISQLQSQSIAAISSKTKHEHCVNINEHKSVTNKLQLKIKSKQQRQTQLERQLIRMKFQIEEKQRKIKKEEKEFQNMKQQVDQLRNKGPMVTQKTAKELQLGILKGIRDKLKLKVDNFDCQKKQVIAES